VGRALDADDIEGELDLLSQDGESRKKLLKAVRGFRGYIEANQNFIPNYGGSLPARREDFNGLHGVRGESSGKQAHGQEAANRWTESGAHNLLQVRTKVLNDQLRESFVRWYPGMQTEQGDGNSEGRGVAPGLKYCPPRLDPRSSQGKDAPLMDAWVELVQL
jgi:hypothetical protein